MDFSHFIVEDHFKQYDICPGEPKPLPTYLQIELTNRCNLHCPSCPRAVRPSSDDILSLRDFERLLEELPLLKHVSFVGAGETLLVKNFAEYVRICSKRRILSSCTTNGLLIKKCLAELIEAGLGKIMISVDAGKEVLLATLRSGLRLTTLRQAILAAIEMTHGTQTSVSAAVTLSAMNIASFVNTICFLVDCGIREVTVESLHHWGNDKSLNKFSLFYINPQQVVESIEEGLVVALKHDLQVHIFDYRRVLFRDHLQSCHCPWPWDAIYVTCKGDVTPCCVNVEATSSNRMGNIHKTSVSEIWNGRRYHNLRKSFFNKHQWSTCIDCVYRMEFGQIMEINK